jgi:hypothetical protein
VRREYVPRFAGEVNDDGADEARVEQAAKPLGARGLVPEEQAGDVAGPGRAGADEKSQNLKVALADSGTPVAHAFAA